MSVERFRISARLMVHLGEALISDELVALTELVKNSYDADANYAKVFVDSKYENGKGIVVVEDDGNGMDYDIITNSFLVLATDFKVKTQKVSNKFKRLALGNKGIGRLSLQRLGEKCTVITKMEDKNAFSFSINWNDYFDPAKEIYDIEIDVKESPELNETFKKGHGTQINIEGIKNPSLWETKQTFVRFKNEILSIINPYSKDEEKFVVSMSINGETMASNQYDIELIRNYSDVYSTFQYLSSANKLIIDIVRQQKYIDLMIKYLNSLRGKDTLDVAYDKEKLYELFKSKHIEIELDNLFVEYPSISKAAYKLNSNFLPGDFCGEIFAYDKTTGRFSKQDMQFLEIINGVKLFRNNFRILPYGDPQNDWLNFTKYSQTYKANIYKNHTTAGYVFIDGEENLRKIQEMTNRQGIINDEYGDSFLTICSVILSGILVQEDISFRSKINPSAAEILKIPYGESRSYCEGLITFSKKEDYKAKVLRDTEAIRSSISKNETIKSDDVKAMNSSLDDISSRISGIQSQVEEEKKLIKIQQDSIDNFKITIGSALISEFMSHEIMRVVNSSLELINRIKEAISKESINVKQTLNLLDSIGIHLNYLSKYASVLDFNSYTKKRKKESVDLKEYIEDTVNSLPFFSDEVGGIKCDIGGDNVERDIIKANFTIALENILINSKYWLDKHNIEDKKVTINIDSSKRTITIYDNGYGIYKEIEDKVFEAFVTAKPDNEGRGIGLYITEKLLSEIGMVISLSNERNNYGQLYKFIIAF